jgi:hypothetical protein
MWDDARPRAYEERGTFHESCYDFPSVLIRPRAHRSGRRTDFTRTGTHFLHARSNSTRSGSSASPFARC